MTVVIIGDIGARPEYDLIRRAIKSRGGDVVTVDVDGWPGDAPTEYTVGEDECILGTRIPFDDVSGVFSIPGTVFDPAALSLREQYDGADTNDVYRRLSEWMGLFQSLVAVFEEYGDTVVISPTESYWNLIEATVPDVFGRNDIPVPATLVTNDAERVCEFVTTHRQAILRPVNSREPPEKLDASELDLAQLDRLLTIPVMVQEMIHGADVRGFVIEEELVDICRYEYDSNPPQAPGVWVEEMAVNARRISPSPRLREAILNVAAITPSSVTAVDLRLQDDGAFTVFDARTPGRFVTSDTSGATEVAGALAEYLLSGTSTTRETD